MAKINLLPWREDLRKDLQKEFYTVITGFVILTLCGVGFIYFLNGQKILNQKERLAILNDTVTNLTLQTEEVKRLETEKQRLKERIGAIEQLQGNRPLIVRLFDEMVISLPDGVSLVSVTQKDEAVTIHGVAQSNARVSSFMKKLERSEWLENPQLDVIETKDDEGKQVSNFTLRFSQVVPSVSGAEEDEA